MAEPETRSFGRNGGGLDAKTVVALVVAAVGLTSGGASLVNSGGKDSLVVEFREFRATVMARFDRLDARTDEAVHAGTDHDKRLRDLELWRAREEATRPPR